MDVPGLRADAARLKKQVLRFFPRLNVGNIDHSTEPSLESIRERATIRQIKKGDYFFGFYD
jgi:hypothetical protein